MAAGADDCAPRTAPCHRVTVASRSARGSLAAACLAPDATGRLRGAGIARAAPVVGRWLHPPTGALNTRTAMPHDRTADHRPDLSHHLALPLEGGSRAGGTHGGRRGVPGDAHFHGRAQLYAYRFAAAHGARGPHHQRPAPGAAGGPGQADRPHRHRPADAHPAGAPEAKGRPRGARGHRAAAHCLGYATEPGHARVLERIALSLRARPASGCWRGASERSATTFRRTIRSDCC
jgi:hypothetical protein